MSSAKDLRERMVAAGAVRAGEADPVADQSPPLAVVAPAEAGKKAKTTSRFTGELPFSVADLIVDIAFQATRRLREPAIRHIDVIQRMLEHLGDDKDAQERLIADLVTNPPRDTGGRRFVRG